MKICILIPVYNEANALGTLLHTLKRKRFDVIVVDDGSTDGSSRIATDMGACVIRHDKRHGKGYSLRAGIAYILGQDYEGIIMMDGDGQHDPGDLNKFIQAAEADSDIVINGNRMANSQGMPWVRVLTNRFMSWIISRACGQIIPDTQCGFRYVSTQLIKEMQLVTDDFEIETEMLIKAAKLGKKILSVPVKTIYEEEVSKIKPIRDTIRFFIYFLKEIRRK